MTAKLTQPASLDDANTLRLPCTADALWEFDSDRDLPPIIDWCRDAGLVPLPLGEGSNVLLPPMLRAAVLRSRDHGVQVLEDGDRPKVRVGAGKNWHQLVKEMLDAGFHGLENLALIPGATGAAPVQNIGAYGLEISQHVLAVHGVDLRTQSLHSLSGADCGFAYRDSRFKGELAGRFVITAVDLQLSRDSQPVTHYPALAERLAQHAGPVTPAAVFEAVVSLRRERLPDPQSTPNVGSFFKNPIVANTEAEKLRERFPALPVYPLDASRAKLSAAWMIDHCGFKGVQRGSAAVSPDHALVLINRGGDRENLLALAREIADRVFKTFGCRLALEPSVIESVEGDDGD
jgi:UDP-N-acetylmuramate dehydrogenase